MTSDAPIASHIAGRTWHISTC